MILNKVKKKTKALVFRLYLCHAFEEDNFDLLRLISLVKEQETLYAWANCMLLNLEYNGNSGIAVSDHSLPKS